ncbi:biotin synthase BioB [Marinococcus halophilus]|uniref:biotin synthase BioB n=1 Tax=Marinococcus halophilus TaxID=1371 RepID=UPI0009A59BE0|nr:biotin synthase BioB [Marinococcus halophilus]
MGTFWIERAKEIQQGKHLTREEAAAFLKEPRELLLEQLEAAYVLRSHYYQNQVKLNMIINTKSGLCSENCGYCAQSMDSKAVISKYRMMPSEEIVQGAREAEKRGAGTYCIVASGRGPSEKELRIVEEAVGEIKATSQLKVCACLGILKEGQGERLKAAGVDRYNHNVNSSERFHDNIVTTHTYEDRTGTVNEAIQAGMSPCSGLIAGMGESHEDIIDVLYALKEIDADSVPVNFLHAIEGTAFEHQPGLRPEECLRILALARMILPSKEIRAAGGREENLKSMQPLALYAVNSIFLGDYLTTPGQAWRKDLQMVEDAGFEIEDNAFTRSAEMYSQ